MVQSRSLRWSDTFLPLIVVGGAILYGYYVLNFPMDSMVGNFLTLPLIMRCIYQHLYLILISAALAVCTSVPLGILLTRPRMKVFCPYVVAVINICQTIPSFAVIALFVSILGIGAKTAIFALWVYSLLPILNNTIAGIIGVDPAIIDAARGMGVTKSRTLGKVELPLAMPIIMAGIRTAVVINVATAVIAAYVGGGGLGDIIIAGKNINRWQVLVCGAGYATLIALLFDHLLGIVERLLTNSYSYGLPSS